MQKKPADAGLWVNLAGLAQRLRAGLGGTSAGFSEDSVVFAAAGQLHARLLVHQLELLTV